MRLLGSCACHIGINMKAVSRCQGSMRHGQGFTSCSSMVQAQPKESPAGSWPTGRQPSGRACASCSTSVTLRAACRNCRWVCTGLQYAVLQRTPAMLEVDCVGSIGHLRWPWCDGCAKAAGCSCIANFWCCLQAEVQHLIPQVKSARSKEAGEYCVSFLAHQAGARHHFWPIACVSAGLTTKNAELHEQLGALMDEVQYKDAVNNVLAQDIVRLQQQSSQVCSQSQPACLQ